MFRPTRLRSWLLLGAAATTCSLVVCHAPLTVKAAPAPTDTIVAVELVLLVDTSGSIDAAEYSLQRNGYAHAFDNSEVIAAIAELRGIAVTYIEWSDADHQLTRIPWRLLESAGDCHAFADEIQAITRTHEGSTCMAPALVAARNALDSSGYMGIKRVIDVSGDGRCKNYDYYVENTDYSADFGEPWADTVPGVANVVTQINGICITTDQAVKDFYTDILPHGPNAFTMQADNFVQFGDVIVEKILRELLELPGMFD